MGYGTLCSTALSICVVSARGSMIREFLFVAGNPFYLFKNAIESGKGSKICKGREATSGGSSSWYDFRR